MRQSYPGILFPLSKSYNATLHGWIYYGFSTWRWLTGLALDSAAGGKKCFPLIMNVAIHKRGCINNTYYYILHFNERFFTVARTQLIKVFHTHYYTGFHSWKLHYFKTWRWSHKHPLLAPFLILREIILMNGFWCNVTGNKDIKQDGLNRLV